MSQTDHDLEFEEAGAHEPKDFSRRQATVLIERERSGELPTLRATSPIAG